MASKRKSTIPCMIPSKSKHREEIILGCLPELLPTIPEDSILSISGEEEETHAPPKKQGNVTWKHPATRGAAYSCPPCRFETTDLTPFLDHLDSHHMDFRAQPSFHCQNCGVSASCFEALILHNAKTHPGTGLAGSPLSTSLRVSKKGGVTVVEQHLILVPTEDPGDTRIPINRTSAMKMTKTKEDLRKIVVSHTGEVHRVDSSGDKVVEIRDPTVLAHMQTTALNGSLGRLPLPSAMQIVSGAGALPSLRSQNRGPIRPSFTTPVNPPNSSLPLNAFPPSDPNNNLPKVMIPLSSIPAYDAAMDSSSFLKMSFSKFPYPTKAELCYLTVVSDFPEEQIKLWFTAQRLKQGISWSPEEIEDTRRRMFNTVFEAAPEGSQKQQPHYFMHQHRTAAQAAAVGPNSRAPQVPQGVIGRWKPGVIVTQSNVIPRPPAKPQSVVRTTAHLQPRAATSTIFDAMSRNLSSSGHHSSSSIISSNISHTSAHRQAVHSHTKLPESEAGGSSLSKDNVSSIAVVCSVNDYHKPTISNSSSLSITSSNGSTSALNSIYSNFVSNNFCIRNTSPTSKATSCNPNANGGIGSQSKSPGHNNENSNASISNSDSNTSTSPLRTSNTEDSDISNHTSKISSENTDTSPFTSNESGVVDTPPVPLHCPIQPCSSLDSFLSKAKKSQEQLEALKKSYVHCQFPNQNEVEELMAATGLTMREVRKWFSDGRYHDRTVKGSQSSLEMHSEDPLPSSAIPSLDLADNSMRNGPTSQPTLSPPPPTLLKQQVPVSATPHKVPRVPSPDSTAVYYKERDPLQLIALEESFSQDIQPSEAEVDRLRVETKMTRREIHSWFSERQKREASQKRDEKNKKDEGDWALHSPPTLTKEDGQFKTEVTSQRLTMKELCPMDEEQSESKGGSPEPKVNPIKINLKMLKVTDPEGKHGLMVVSPEQESDISKMMSSPSSSLLSDRITPDQMHLLRKTFASTPWPNNQQLDELVMVTGLHKSEVVRWFSDSRRIHKNGQLPWLDTYQNTLAEARVWFAEEDRHNITGHTGTQRDDQTNFMGPDLARGLAGSESLEREQACVLEGSQRYLSSLLKSGDPEGLDDMTRVATPMQDPWAVKGEEHQQPIDSQSFREHQAQDKQSRDSLRRELLKV
ncbi:zinc fingers and homeoboxes protein 3-like isoform X1 [Clupea harengus]|uniref:Zinc fingers and homeoboxes protein 3-like isoform X1 n=1 Tax=Clupea harengus TaxID=7950 RepID=A0A8M1KEQ1_CLUHA|nr:zinc fingers and homeoboxes protein 3-like isoform X1 [Clupea harengus]XP_042560990.1 zinc fingers and homeoboxes protein 3-like isoform X1 [Clupea harengus]XP_042560991.1 zinc fingers and homeoboxes protein 3-like isoform X1 [Clupea harengus]XP_042560992.1 zinc fingers and homeoboxes protein 3-like isoform X1 [Clupea harengus]